MRHVRDEILHALSSREVRWASAFLLLCIFLAAVVSFIPVTFAEKKKEFEVILARASGEKVNNEYPAGLFREHYEAYGPEVMVAAVDDLPYCHAEGHNLGRVIYEKADFVSAINLCQSKCGSGCMHGVLMGFFSEKIGNSGNTTQHVELEDLTPELRGEFTRICAEGTVTEHIQIGSCYHAVGHALAVLADYDVSSGLNLCEVLKESGIGAQYYCETGVFMQHDTEFGNEMSADASSAMCLDYAHPAACFRYKVRRAFQIPEKYEEAKRYCESLSGSHQRGCFHGLGLAGFWLVKKEPAFLERLCVTPDEVATRMCFEGALGALRKDVALGVCEHVSMSDVCVRAAQVRNLSMNRDFELYTQ